MYFGVRNKYCSVSTKRDEEWREHDCYKNWDDPYSSMETDVLVV